MAADIIEQHVQRYLAGRTRITALLGTTPVRLWVGKMPQDDNAATQYPAAMFHRVSTTPVDALDDGPSGAEWVRLQFNSYSGDYFAAKRVAETLRLELMGLRGVIDGTCQVLGCIYEMSLDFYEDDVRDADADTEGVHHVVSDFSVLFAASTF